MTAYAITFALIVIGRLLAATRILPESTADVLNRLVISLCLPAVILIHIPRLHINIDLWPLVAAPWLLTLISAALIIFLSQWLKWSRPVTAVLLLLVPLGNTSFLGYALISALLGAESLRYAVVYDQFGSFLILCTYALFVVAWYADDQSVSVKVMLGRMATFPPFLALILALIAGNHWVPPWLMQGFEWLALALLPMVTLAIGLQLRLKLVPEYRLPLMLGLMAKLMLLPGLALWCSGWLSMSDEIRTVIVLESAMPPMITAAVLLSNARLAAPLATALVAWGVLGSALTIPMWFWLLHGM